MTTCKNCRLELAKWGESWTQPEICQLGDRLAMEFRRLGYQDYTIEYEDCIIKISKV